MTSLLKHRRSRSRAIGLAASVAVFAVAIGLSRISTGSDSHAASAPAAQSAPTVSYAYPTVKAIAEWDEFTGQFRAVDSVEVRARVSGYLEAIAFEDGQLVERGDLLFRIDARPFEAELAAARADLAGTRAAFEHARAEQERARRLVDRQAISVEEAERRDRVRLQAEAAVASAQARVDQAELNLEFTEVKAPISGRISDDFVSEGNLIVGGAQGGTLLTSIVSLDPIYFEFTTSEADYLKYVREGEGDRYGIRDNSNPVYGKLLDEDEFGREGHLSFVDNQLDPSTGTMRGRVTFDNPDGVLAPGMFGRIQLQYSSDEAAILVPDRAIQTDQDVKFVWVVGEHDVARRRPIELGPVVDGLRVVRGGLEAEDRVIVGGTQFVMADAPIAPQPADGNRVALATRS